MNSGHYPNQFSSDEMKQCDVNTALDLSAS